MRRFFICSEDLLPMFIVDDVDALAEDAQELEALVESSDKTCKRYKMEISTAKGPYDDKQRQWHPEVVKRQKLESVSFNFSDNGSKPFLLRIATATLTKLTPIRSHNHIYANFLVY